MVTLKTQMRTVTSGKLKRITQKSVFHVQLINCQASYSMYLRKSDIGQVIENLLNKYVTLIDYFEAFFFFT